MPQNKEPLVDTYFQSNRACAQRLLKWRQYDQVVISYHQEPHTVSPGLCKPLPLFQLQRFKLSSWVCVATETPPPLLTG